MSAGWRLLVFQHIECEHPGSLRKGLKADGVDWTVVELDAGDAISRLEDFDALWVMGGPMDVWETEEHPWLVDEKEAIRRWVRELERPFLGLCLGHQLLAQSPMCPNQAMRVGPRAWSMQYHVEVEPDTVRNWGAVPSYRKALEAAVGPGALDQMAKDADRCLGDFTATADRLYRNFTVAVGLEG